MAEPPLVTFWPLDRGTILLGTSVSSEYQISDSKPDGFQDVTLL